MTTHSKTVAIMQPTYLPWLGYFDIMEQVDEFVLLDHVQFERHSWQHRNRIKGPDGEIMLTLSVKRSGLHTPISAAELNDPRDLKRHLQTIRQAYARASYVQALLPRLEARCGAATTMLVDVLLGVIDVLRQELAVSTPMVRSSELAVSGTRDDLVRAICDQLGATSYLATTGSRAYMQRGHAFADGLVSVRYHTYEPVPYPQLHNSFVPYLSALDAILNLGPAARDVMIAGRCNPTNVRS